MVSFPDSCVLTYTYKLCCGVIHYFGIQSTLALVYSLLSMYILIFITTPYSMFLFIFTCFCLSLYVYAYLYKHPILSLHSTPSHYRIIIIFFACICFSNTKFGESYMASEINSKPTISN